MFCSKCGAKNVNDANYCGKCGSPIESSVVTKRVCPKCGNDVKSKSSFCNKCGAKLSNVDSDENSEGVTSYVWTCSYCQKEFNSKKECIDHEKTCKSNNDVGKPKKILYPISMTKLVVMSVVTFGIYEVYWAYKNWKYIRDNYGENISPFWRSMFPFFYIHGLFKKISTVCQDKGYNPGYSSGWLAAAYIILSILYKLPENYWLLSLFAVLVFIPVQRAINYINNNSGESNSGYSIKESLVVIVGIFWWILILFVPSEA